MLYPLSINFYGVVLCEGLRPANIPTLLWLFLFLYLEYLSSMMQKQTSTRANKRLLCWSIDETSLTFYLWTSLICLGCLYNLIMIVIMVFEEIHRNFYHLWISFNIAFDIIFLLDLFVLTRRRDKYCLIDIICILPTDLLLYLKPDLSLSRMNRLLKCYRLAQFNTLTEIRTKFPNLYRITKLIFTCFVIFHWNGCIYFFISVLYGFSSTFQFRVTMADDCSVESRRNKQRRNTSLRFRSHKMVFSKFVKQYALSFYWSALTLVTLGEQPSPNDSFQNSFEICDTLLGLVLFAVIVGDVGNMVTTMNMKRSNFEEILDGCKSYMVYSVMLSLFAESYLSSFILSVALLNELPFKKIAEFLPPRLYGQLAVHIHMESLRRVKLFEDCELNLLYELILKLELRVYSPMDDICRKGDVGTEMYIVKEGAVEVVNDNGTEVWSLSGTVFGELSILNIPGNKNGNRRTANVRSVGYSDLYVLSKDDLWKALREYPESKKSLMEKGSEDNLLDEKTDEQELDENLPLDEQLEAVAKVLRKLEVQLDKAEQRFQVNRNYILTLNLCADNYATLFTWVASITRLNISILFHTLNAGTVSLILRNLLNNRGNHSYPKL
uniref:Cyclic nucleotide-binding domain-containing protein n=1 Tax=Angiostrongylus cantonensis TaxID=6313 RepID=A0A158PAG3_ANGCA